MKTICQVFIVLSFIILFFKAGIALPNSDIEFTPRISTTEEYDDNIYLSGNDDVMSDWITIVSPGINIDLHSPVSILSLDYEAGFTFYQKESANNAIRHRALLDIYRQISPTVKLMISDIFIKSEDPIEIREETLNVRRTRNTYYQNTGTAKILYHFGDENLCNIGYRNLILENKEPLVEDSVYHKPFIETIYWFNSSNGISLDYAYNKGEFEKSDDFIQYEGKVMLSHWYNPHTEISAGYGLSHMDIRGLNGDYHIHDWSSGITHTWKEGLSLSLGLGYYFLNSSDIKDTNTYSAYAELEKEFKRGFIKIGTTKGYDENFFDAGNLRFSECWIIEGKSSYMLTDNIALNLSGFYRNDVYPVSEVGYEDYEENRWVIGTGLAYNVFKWFLARIDYVFRERDSNIDAYDYKDNRLIIKLEFER